MLTDTERQLIEKVKSKAANARTWANSVPALLAIIERLETEANKYRETNTRLNRRCQAADAAVADAKRCVDEICRNQTKTGTPWCGGNFGRALLACANERLETENTELRQQLERATASHSGRQV